MARKSNSKTTKGNEKQGAISQNEMVLCKNELTL
jgi:hypothetical protein